VEVVMEREDGERSVKVPAYLMRIIESDFRTADFWPGLSFTQQKEHVREIEESRRPETREKRIETMMAALRKGEWKE
jgi:uncharacterized protein YdeI (YjbR/CyaY-like superfamily)